MFGLIPKGGGKIEMDCTQLLNEKAFADGIIESKDLKTLIENDNYSPQKRKMLEGERYYIGEHDILRKDFTCSKIAEPDEKGQEEITEFKNPNRSNHHNINAFHGVLVNQKVSYLAGKEPTISVKDAENNPELKAYESILADFADDTFNEVMQDLVTGASNKGCEYLHIYYDEKGNLHYCVVSATQCIPIYSEDDPEKLDQLIRYYSKKEIENGEYCLKNKVEHWTKNSVTYYEEKEGKFISTMSCPHWFTAFYMNGVLTKQEPHTWGRVPFILLKNNAKMTTDLEYIKGLIDAYDLVSSEGTNNLLDYIDLYWVIKGHCGESAKAIADKLRINRAVNVEGLDAGSVEAKQVELPITGRLEFLKMLRRDIFHFGMGVDTDSDKFGNAPSGVSLKFQYTLLDLKAQAMAAKLRKVIKELLWFFTEDYNRKNHTSYDSSLIQVTLNKTMITNDMELVTMIQNSKGIVSDKTLLGMHPFVSDVNAELEELETQEQKEQAEYEKFLKPSEAGGEDERKE